MVIEVFVVVVFVFVVAVAVAVIVIIIIVVPLLPNLLQACNKLPTFDGNLQAQQSVL